MDGHPHHVLAEARTKPVTLIFISHDCPICNTYAPEFARLAKKYSGRADVDLVYTEPFVTSKIVQRHASDFGLKGARLFMDPTGRLAKACRADTTPEAAVFDSKGHETYLGRIDDLFVSLGKRRSSATRPELRSAIEAALSHRPARPAAGPPIGCTIETSPSK